MGRGILAVLVVAALVLPAVAWADKQIDAAPPNRFTADSYTMDQGEKLVFHNGDTVSHDVTATQKGDDGKPLFRTPTVDAGKSAPVDGSQYLATGHYDFICTLHPNMKSTLHVSVNGTPATRPGASKPATSPAANDKTAPSLTVRIASRRTKIVRARHALTVRVQLNEAGHVVLRAVARPKVGGKLVTVASGTTHLNKAGIKRVRLGLTSAGRAALRHRRSLAVIVTGRAEDFAGNKASETHGRTLR